MTEIEKLTDFEAVKLRLKFASDHELSTGTRSFFKTNMLNVMTAVDSELTSVLGANWTTLKTQSNGLFASHTILVLWNAVKETLFEDLSPEEQNALKWACLLFAISKHGSPFVLGPDHCQAYRSANTALTVFEKLKILVPNER